MSDNATFYDAFAKYYPQYYAEVDATKAVRRWKTLLEFATPAPATQFKGPLPTPNLLDLACGPGWHLRPWQIEGFNVSGLDASPAMLNIAAIEAHAGPETDIPLYCADVRQTASLSALYGKFSLVVSHFNFLNLFTVEELISVLRSVRHMLVRGGHFATDIQLFQTPLDYGATERIVLDGVSCIVETQSRDDGHSVERIWQIEGQRLIESYWVHEIEKLQKIAKTEGLELILEQDWTNSAESITHKSLLVFSKIWHEALLS